MSLPPILPPPAPAAPPAAPRALPRKPAAPRKAAPPPPAEEKPPRKLRGAPSERAGPFPSSWPCASLQKQQPRRPALAPPQPQPRGRSCESLCAAAGPAAGAGEAALRFSLSLPPEAALVLQRRSLEKQRGRPSPSAGTERLLPGSRSKAALAAGGSARRGARAGPGSSPGDLRALLKISLLNERHRYDDVEYEEEAAPGAVADEGLVRKCTEWLRGVESAAGRDRADKLETLPHLGAL
ncbi:proline-rich protein 18 [Chelonoidis abingdonii]|uniref:Proline rich 18 n=1 Tax=Chelonoidis abingdonii TaxID=106734 RepID=A0A8C0J705_CHEAB|nr:proline-rich protein 18 [Chelonoidis abingdonii]